MAKTKYIWKIAIIFFLFVFEGKITNSDRDSNVMTSFTVNNFHFFFSVSHSLKSFCKKIFKFSKSSLSHLRNIKSGRCVGRTNLSRLCGGIVHVSKSPAMSDMSCRPSKLMLLYNYQQPNPTTRYL